MAAIERLLAAFVSRGFPVIVVVPGIHLLSRGDLPRRRARQGVFSSVVPASVQNLVKQSSRQTGFMAYCRNTFTVSANFWKD